MKTLTQCLAHRRGLISARRKKLHFLAVSWPKYELLSLLRKDHKDQRKLRDAALTELDPSSVASDNFRFTHTSPIFLRCFMTNV